MSRGALNVLELWPTVGYLHEFIGCQTKQSLVYDLQEPFRWLADVGVMDAFESGVLDLPDFYFTGDDYRYRFEPEAKQRFLDLLRGRFNSAVKYRGRALKWDTVIEQKTAELGCFLNEKSSALDLTQPEPRLERWDDRELRAKVLALTSIQATRLGIGRSTLHYLRKRAGSHRSFALQSSIRKRIQEASLA